MCPAAMGKCRCALTPESMALDYERPEVVSPPEHPPTCCAHKTISVSVSIDAKRRQRHDYPSRERGGAASSNGPVFTRAQAQETAAPAMAAATSSDREDSPPRRRPGRGTLRRSSPRLTT